jgi:hypothetical protein
MLNKLIERLSGAAGRRSFLGQATKVALGVAVGVVAAPPSAEACCYESCCNLCHGPSGFCGGCTCEWSWDCCGSWTPLPPPEDGSSQPQARRKGLPTGCRWGCKECYQGQEPPCGPGCDGVDCSLQTVIGLC